MLWESKLLNEDIASRADEYYDEMREAEIEAAHIEWIHMTEGQELHNCLMRMKHIPLSDIESVDKLIEETRNLLAVIRSGNKVEYARLKGLI